MIRIGLMGLLFLMAAGVKGQDLSGTFQYGAGACYSPFTVWPQGDHEIEYSKGTKGFDIFGFIRLRPKTIINLTAEVKYSWKHYGYEGYDGGMSGGSDYDLDYSVGYLDISLLPLFAIRTKERFYLGPVLCLGFLVNSHATGTIESWSMSGYYDTLFVDGPRKGSLTSMAFRVGLRFEFDIPVSPKTQLLVINRYEYTCFEPHFFTISLGLGLGRIFVVKPHS